MSADRARLFLGSNVRSEQLDRLAVGGSARAEVMRRTGGDCDGCGLEWPWAIYLFLIDESSPAPASNLQALCWRCPHGHAGRLPSLVAELSLRGKLRAVNN